MGSQVTLPKTLEEMNPEQLEALASEWGFKQLGRPMPTGVPLAKISDCVPLQLQVLDWKALLLGLLVPMTLMSAGYFWLWYMHSIIPGWQQAICWLLVGTGYFSLFNGAASDAARTALLPGTGGGPGGMQAIIGSILMAPSLYSLEAWRLSLMVHYNECHLLAARGDEKDAAQAAASTWQPMTKRRISKMGKIERDVHRFVFSWAPFLRPLLVSVSHWVASFGALDLKRCYPPLRTTMVLSWSVPFWFAGLIWPSIVASGGGLGSLIDIWLAPWLVFHSWMGLMTLLQHTAPHLPLHDPSTHDESSSAINGTVTVDMPRWLEVLLNNAGHHLPQHLHTLLPVPFYHARAATEAIKRKLGPYMTTASLNPRLIRNLLEKWQVYDEDKRTFITFRQAERESRVGSAAADVPAISQGKVQ